MAEFQTVAAAIDLAAIVCVFLRKVKDAEGIAKDISDRIDRLSLTLETVQSVTEQHDGTLASSDSQIGRAKIRINSSVRACRHLLERIQGKLHWSVGGDKQSQEINLLDRFKVAFHSTSISRIQTEIESHINILQLEVQVLQVSQTQSSHFEMRDALNRLYEQTQSSRRSLDIIQRQCRQDQSTRRGTLTMTEVEEIPHEASEKVIQSFLHSLEMADEVYERLTSEHCPDDRSIRLQADLVDDQSIAPSSEMHLTPSESDPDFVSFRNTPSLKSIPSTDGHAGTDDEAPPLRLLENIIEKHRERFHLELHKLNWKTAQKSLQETIRYSKMREEVYHKPFTDRVKLNEEVASLCQKQGNYGAAVAKVNELLRESGPSDTVEKQLVQARQYQLLGFIYFEHYHTKPEATLHSDSGDLATAENYAHRAMKRRDSVLTSGKAAGLEAAERSAQRDCIQLLVNIFEARDKTVEANVYKSLLQDDEVVSESIKQASVDTSGGIHDYDVVENKQDLLLEAIKTRDSLQIQTFLSANDVDIEKLPGSQKTELLLFAIKQGDESTINRLLGVGADVNGKGRKGITPLHLAASTGTHKIVHHLVVQHDATINVRDTSGETPLLKAVLGNHATVVESLANLDADFSIRYDEDLTLLHHAVRQETPEMTNLVLKLAPTLSNQVDRRGMTALQHCAEQEDLEQARALLEHRNKVDIDILDSHSRSALFFVASNTINPLRRTLVELFLEHGANPTAGRSHPKFMDYPMLRPYLSQRRTSNASRQDSVVTQGSTDAASGVIGKFRRRFSSK